MRSETRIAKTRVEKQKINVVEQGQPKHLNIQPHDTLVSFPPKHVMWQRVFRSTSDLSTAVHCCDPALSVLVMFVSRNVLQVVSALQCIVFAHFFG